MAGFHRGRMRGNIDRNNTPSEPNMAVINDEMHRLLSLRDTLLIWSINPKKRPLPVHQLEFIAKVSWVNNSNDFYVVPCFSEDTTNEDPGFLDVWNNGVGPIIKPLQFIEEALQNCEKQAFPSRTKPTKGELVSVNINSVESSIWKRGAFLVEDEEGMKVQLIDTGEVLSVPISAIGKLPKDLADIAPMAYHCSLRSLPEKKIPISKGLNTFQELIVGKGVYVSWFPDETSDKIEYGNGFAAEGFAEKYPYQVELVMPKKMKDGSIRDIMISSIIAKVCKWNLSDPLCFGDPDSAEYQTDDYQKYRRGVSFDEPRVFLERLQLAKGEMEQLIKNKQSEL